MRGKDAQRQALNQVTRITPADAGKSPPRDQPDTLRWDHPRVCGESRTFAPICTRSRDHPRVCGEKSIAAARSTPSTGSPPRMRGKVHYAGLDYDPIRITPAYAGKSCSVPGECGLSRDHPRVCGEKLNSCIPAGIVIGSPPRMRGKGPSARTARKTIRITPAYAGKSTAAFSSFSLSRDHPRVCGEKTKKIP